MYIKSINKHIISITQFFDKNNTNDIIDQMKLLQISQII